MQEELERERAYTQAGKADLGYIITPVSDEERCSQGYGAKPGSGSGSGKASEEVAFTPSLKDRRQPALGEKFP